MHHFLPKYLLSILILFVTISASLMGQVTTYRLTQVTVLEIPDNWYATIVDEQPDVFIELLDNGTVLYTAGYVNDTDVPVAFLPNIAVDSTKNYQIKVWDYDPTSANDSLGAVTISGNGHDTLYATIQGVTGRLALAYETVLFAVVAADDANSILETFDVFPNPTEGELTIRIAPAHASEFDLQVVDLNGRVIHHENLGMISTLFEHNINMREFASGVYFLHIRSKNGIASHQILRQR